MLLRALAAAAAVLMAAVLVVAGCHGPSSAAVPRPVPNRAPTGPAGG